MTCVEVRDQILECFDDPGTALPAVVAEHLETCTSCARFQAAQHSLDLALTQRFSPPALSDGFQKELLRKVRQDRHRQIWNAVPDIVHIGGGLVASTACALLIPHSQGVMLGVGVAFTLGTYVIQTLVGLWLEDEGL